jgi:hypothetical protein
MPPRITGPVFCRSELRVLQIDAQTMLAGLGQRAVASSRPMRPEIRILKLEAPFAEESRLLCRTMQAAW